jgi:hypothetical protein
MKKMRNISGSISKAAFLLLALGLLTQLSAQEVVVKEVTEQDTLRTYGPRIGIDLTRFLYILADPSQTGAELSLDFEIYKNVYPVFEAGYNSISESEDLFDYSSNGTYARVGLDYNVLPVKKRSLHHSITMGFRYGMSVFNHRAENVFIPGDYWDYIEPEPYENNLTGHWAELVGAMKAELLPNFFLGWSVRYKVLLNPNMDPLMSPELVPGYGTGGKSSMFGLTYSIYYKIPILKK